jgi:hypothetical protein
MSYIYCDTTLHSFAFHLLYAGFFPKDSKFNNFPKRSGILETLSFHGNEDLDCGLVGHDTMKSDRWLPAICRTIDN